MRRAKKFAGENVRRLAPLVTADEPLIGIEPSAILGFRDEYPALVGVSLRDEFIDRENTAGRIDSSLFTREPKTVHLHGHCHQKALAPLEPTMRMLGLPQNYHVKAIPSGCCGMAGSFGYEAEHYDVSMKIGELVLFPAVRGAAADTLIAAPGTSCRHQIHDGTARKALHPAQVLRMAVAT